VIALRPRRSTLIRRKPLQKSNERKIRDRKSKINGKEILKEKNTEKG
jgi:hypothetical protein